MAQVKKVLITGGTGYIGNFVTKMLAASHPEVHILSMSRRPID
jgi:nucleoside-diphosphate-sugar epimerase